MVCYGDLASPPKHTQRILFLLSLIFLLLLTTIRKEATAFPISCQHIFEFTILDQVQRGPVWIGHFELDGGSAGLVATASSWIFDASIVLDLMLTHLCGLPHHHVDDEVVRPQLKLLVLGHLAQSYQL